MKWISLIFISLLATTCYAQKSQSALNLYLINFETRYERGNNQEIEGRRPLNLALGYQQKNISVVMEYARYNEDSGNATASIERTHQDVVFWGRYHFKEIQSEEFSTFFMAGVGAGGFQEEVKTRFMGDSRTDKEQMKFMSGLMIGMEMGMNLTPTFALVGGLEGRTLIASDFDPNPLWSLLIRLGMQFSF